MKTTKYKRPKNKIKYSETSAYGATPSYQEVDEGWRHFWAKRGVTTLPVVSSHIFGGFELPTPMEVNR